MKFLKERDDQVSIEIIVVPNARKTEMVGEHDGRLKLKIHAPPVDGKANEEIIRFFSDVFSLPKSRIRISHGESSKRKTVVVAGVSLELAQKLLL